MYILYKRNCTANIQQKYYNASTTQQTQHNYYIIGTTLVLKTGTTQVNNTSFKTHLQQKY